MKKLITILTTTLVLTTQLAFAQGIVVSSKIDTEGGLLGNIIFTSLKQAGLPVENKLTLGGTSIVREAMLSGQIDIYPEYTGNAAFFFNEADSPVWKNAAAGFARAAKLDLEKNQIVWLPAASANNTWAIAVRTDLSEKYGLKSMSDFGRFVTGGGKIKLAASTEFVNSPAVLPAFEKTYAFSLKPSQLLVLSGGNTAATIAAAAQQTSGVNAAMVYATDGAISVVGLTVMQDDKSVQPVYAASPVVRQSVLKQYPAIATILKPIFAKLDLKTLQKLNGRIQLNGEAPNKVAADFLKTIDVIN